MAKKIELPSALVNAVREQRAVLFLGAGASMNALTPDGKKSPSAVQLRDLISERFLGKRYSDYDLQAVAEMAIANEG